MVGKGARECLRGNNLALTDVKERTLVQKKVAQFLLEMENLPLRKVHPVPISSVDDDLDVMVVKILHPQTKEDLGEKYEPKEPICPMLVEFYRRQILECDERSKGATVGTFVRYVFFVACFNIYLFFTFVTCYCFTFYSKDVKSCVLLFTDD